MKKLLTSKNLLTYTLLTSLALLPGCWKTEDKEQKASEETAAAATAPQAETVLVTKNNAPFVTQSEINDFINKIGQEQPGLQTYIAQDPMLEEQVVNMFLDQKIISDLWLKDEGITNTPEYKKAFELFMLQLANAMFEEQLYKNFEISDNDITTYYNNNKKRFVKTQGGVKAQEVIFADEKSANDFATKAKAPNAKFSELSKEAGKEIKNLGTITKDSSIDTAIKMKLSKLSKTPAIDVIKVGKEFHVVNSLEKAEDEYQTLDEAKEFARQLITYEKFPQLVQEKKAELRKKYNIEINQEYFKQKAAQACAMIEEGDETEQESETTMPSAA